jgi:hypothetical protein
MGNFLKKKIYYEFISKLIIQFLLNHISLMSVPPFFHYNEIEKYLLIGENSHNIYISRK